MSGRTAAVAAFLALLLYWPTGAAAWEPATTHAGLTEVAAERAGLHEILRRDFGLSEGAHASLLVPPEDAPGLFAIIRRLNPVHGYVADARGSLPALSWLVVGSVVADNPPWHAGNHYLDPRTKRGLSAASVRGILNRLRHSVVPAVVGSDTSRGGIAATEWISHPDNPMALAGFHSQYKKAVTSQTEAERRRHVAGMLIAAGALLHVLQDMGSPSHVRDDLAAHYDQIGRDISDVGSRYERIAALAYGRLGVPEPAELPASRPLLQFFTADDHTGLADLTERRWFSAHTLPRSLRASRNATSLEMERIIDQSLRRPEPRPRAIDLVASRSERGATLADETGVCVARYRLERRLRWIIDDECVIEQLAVVLPTVAGYSTSFLQVLFRGRLVIGDADGAIEIRGSGTSFGPGQLALYWDDADGNRTEYVAADTSSAGSDAPLARGPLPPAGAVRLVALFEGVDGDGAPLLATASAPLPLASSTR